MTWDRAAWHEPNLRVMYWPNEPAHLYPGFQQAGGRQAFAAMADSGALGAVEIFSYRVERARHATLEAFEAAALTAVAAFAPDILFVQHVFGTDLRESFWTELRTIHPRTTLTYHEGDPFDRSVKRVDAATIAILRQADLVLACGLGTLARILEKPGGKPIGYLPHCFVRSRFAVSDPREATKTHDLVMIGNRGNRRRLRHLYVPGGRRRAELATRLSDTFGTHFALYGNGWDGLSAARGLLPFFEQEAAIQAGRVSVNWDHFDQIDFYFSDRLPISLAAGVPHVTTRHKGYDTLFADTPGLYACDSVEEVVETTRWLLSRPDVSLMEEGLAAKEWVFANMEANDVFARGVEQAARAHRQRVRV